MIREIKLPFGDIRKFCRENHVRRLAVFGSALRDDFRPESDLDILVEFTPGHTPGLRFFGVEEELSQLLGRRVDLNTSASLSPYFREEVLKEARDIYVQT